MFFRRSVLPGLALFLFAGVSFAGDHKTPPELMPAPVTLPKDAAAEFLSALKKQTGNAVFDLRSSKDFRLPELGATTFWPALDAFCRKNGCRVSMHHNPQAATLLDGSEKEIPVAYDGIFRVALDRVALVRDFDQAVHRCQVAVQVGWEPRFRPFFMDVGKCEAVYAGGKEKMTVDMSGQGKQELTGAGGSAIVYRFPAPPKRSFDHIETLTGTMTVIGPTRMLAFAFDKLRPIARTEAPRKETQEQVSVTLREVKTQLDRWTVTLEIENAPGVPEFESYQSWWGHNEVALVRGKERWVATLTEDDGKAQRATLVYDFADARRVKGSKLGDWTLTVTTPHRIVEVPVRFQIRDIELP
ncbi:MAG: hypothetical protein U0793_21725 [Gemmataceae bacterium]